MADANESREREIQKVRDDNQERISILEDSLHTCEKELDEVQNDWKNTHKTRFIIIIIIILQARGVFKDNDSLRNLLEDKENELTQERQLAQTAREDLENLHHEFQQKSDYYQVMNPLGESTRSNRSPVEEQLLLMVLLKVVWYISMSCMLLYRLKTNYITSSPPFL